MGVVFEVQHFLLVPRQWTLLLTPHPRCYFLLDVLEFRLGRVHLRKQQKMWRTSMNIFILHLCCFLFSSMSFLKLQPLWLHQISASISSASEMTSFYFGSFCCCQGRKCIQRISEVNVDLTCVLLSTQKVPSLKSSYIGCFPLTSNSCFVYFV